MPSTLGVRFLVAAAACVVACSPTGAIGDPPGGAADSLARSPSDSASSGGAAATGDPAWTSGGTSDPACLTAQVRAPSTTLPADVIWVVDQSGSMNQETAYVQDRINAFAQLIDASGIDYRVVLIAASASGNSICVPPPLSNGSCGDGPRFRHVDAPVDSHDPLDVAMAQYPSYREFLRPDAVKHFVFVSDDNPTDPPLSSAAAFSAAVEAAEPHGIFNRWTVHAIYAYGSIPIVGCLGFFGIGAAIGTIYEDLVNQTHGARGQICNGDWQPVFDAITHSVATSAKIACTYDIPAANVASIDPGHVNVTYVAGGKAPGAIVPHVAASSECAAGTTPGGWYFDDAAHPQRVVLCAETCATAQADTAAEIDLQFGCETVVKLR